MSDLAKRDNRGCGLAAALRGRLTAGHGPLKPGMEVRSLPPELDTGLNRGISAQTTAPYLQGARYRRTDDGLVVDPEEAAVLRDAISRLSRGESVTRIIREWNVAGIKTSKGARWSSLGLRRILLSEHLTGGRGYPRVLTDEEAAVARSALNSAERRTGRPPGVRSPLPGSCSAASAASSSHQPARPTAVRCHTADAGVWRSSPSRWSGSSCLRA
jgi:Recombinase